MDVRNIIIHGEIARIPLTSGYFAIIDAADVPFVSGVNWAYKAGKKQSYAQRVVREDGSRRTILLHRVILSPPSSDMHVDHINGNGLDNRRENLRLATRSENAWNRGANVNNRSGFKGVTWHNASKKWQAQIMANGVSRHLGLFSVPEDAYSAYIEAASQFHRNFALTSGRE